MSRLLHKETATRATDQDVTVRVVAEPRRSGLGTVVQVLFAGTLLVVVGLVAGLVTGVLSIPNPFASSTVDRSAPALLERVSDLSEYSAARGHFQQTVDFEDDVAVLPSFLAGERTTFVAHGTVDAVVDFSDLSDGAVQVADDGAVTVTLPRPTLETATLDPEASRVVGRDRGVLDRIGGIFNDTPTGDQRYYVAAQEKLDKAARHSDLVRRAERNTSKMVRGLFGELGYDDVTVVFQAPVTNGRTT